MLKTISNDLLSLIEQHKIWRKTLGSSGKRLSVVLLDLSQLDLRGMDFGEVDLPKARFDGSILRGAEFY
jgi:uncharacterized protein YjbI with pentapeptide repeats